MRNSNSLENSKYEASVVLKLSTQGTSEKEKYNIDYSATAVNNDSTPVLIDKSLGLRASTTLSFSGLKQVE